jgi:RNA polymerase-binding protein DksA
MRTRDLERIRETLHAERDRVQRIISRHAKAIQHADDLTGEGSGKAHSNHMADQGSDEIQYETMIHLAGAETDYLFDIEEALAKLENGTYGRCEAGGHTIAVERLLAVPTARLCIACQEKQEKLSA